MVNSSIFSYFIFYYVYNGYIYNVVWVFSLMFISLSGYLLCCTKKTNIFYLQIASGCGMFATSKIGRTFLGLA